MEEIRIKNIRRFKDSGPIGLNGITLLLGCNSSGKSTIARMLPLLKQSVNTATRSPLLWNGDLVDWGSYEDIQKEDGDIQIGFSLKTSSIDSRPYYRTRQDADRTELWKIQFTLKSKNNNHYCSNVSFESKKISLSYDINKSSEISSLIINGQEVQAKEARAQRSDKNIIPACVIDDEANLMAHNMFYRSRMAMNSSVEEKTSAIIEKAKFLYHWRTGEDKIFNLVFRLTRLGPLTNEELLKHLKQNLRIFGSKRDFVEKIDINNEEFRNLHLELSKGHVTAITSLLSNEVSEQLSKLQYANPLRATAKRYYRPSDLVIGYISPDGNNLPDVLNGLSKGKRSELSDYCKINLGFEINIKLQGGHISIQVKGESDIAFKNITDVGFGIPQILPLIVQSWMLREFKSKNASSQYSPPLFVIEQPELHLHPKMQADYAQSAALSAIDNNCKFLIETHSESIVRRILQLVKSGKLPIEMVNIYCIETGEPGQSGVKKAEINKDGTLSNWPYDFFDTH